MKVGQVKAFLRFQLNPYKDLGMDTNCLSDLTDVCGQLTDPRAANAKHKLTNILILAILGVLAGANTWGAVAAHARDRRDLLAELLDLSAGIPSHDTFSRLFRLLDPDAFERLFSMIVTSLHNAATTAASTGAEQRELLSAAIDGKVSRRSFRGVDKKNPIHMVSAWSSESGLVLGQLSTHAKSNEITAIPKLLDTVDVRGVVVTIDAMGRQRDIATEDHRQGRRLHPADQGQPADARAGNRRCVRGAAHHREEHAQAGGDRSRADGEPDARGDARRGGRGGSGALARGEDGDSPAVGSQRGLGVQRRGPVLPHEPGRRRSRRSSASVPGPLGDREQRALVPWT